MTYQQLRQKYPLFTYESYSYRQEKTNLVCQFHYSASEQKFVHTVTFENLTSDINLLAIDSSIFQLGIAEMLNYWKLFCSPNIKISIPSQSLSDTQLAFWHKLIINGFGQYFYENSIDFTSPEFITLTTIESNNTKTLNKLLSPENPNSVLIPLGGGKDSIVTLKLLEKDFALTPIIVKPASPASLHISQLAGFSQPVIVDRKFDPQLFALNAQGFLNGHVPYSAILAFIFLVAAQARNIPFVAVSNERSSEEGNVQYLGHSINHQYSKTLEFEKDFSNYISSLNLDVNYFSLLRPLYELQIAKIFSHYPEYFSIFRSCNIGQKTNSWCGHCAKCLSIALTLTPWIGREAIINILGSDPISNPTNVKLLHTMISPNQVKPFECVTTTKEALLCLELITNKDTPTAHEFLSQLGPSNMPKQFLDLLENSYANS